VVSGQRPEIAFRDAVEIAHTRLFARMMRVEADNEMKAFYALIPVVLSVFLVVAVSQVSDHRSSSNKACAQAIRTRLADPSTFSEIAAEYKRSDETWGRDEMMLEIADELDHLTLAESNRLHSGDGAAREKLAIDLKPEFAALLPSEGTHFGFAVSKVDFDAQNQSSALIRHVAYCKFLIVDGADAHEPFSVVIR
jgi:hypothetical protein